MLLCTHKDPCIKAAHQSLAQAGFQLKALTGALQMAEAALADGWVINGDRGALQ